MSGDDSQQLILSPLSLDNSYNHLSDPHHAGWGEFLDNNLTFKTNFTSGDCEYERISVKTPHGSVEVAREGLSLGTAPVLITFHDLGLNHITNFKKLFDSPSMGLILTHFTVLHVNAPGQEPGAKAMEEEEPFPNMEQLSESVEYICHHFGIFSFVGLGSGLGANVLIRLGKRRPKLVEGLVLFNTDNQSAGWIEWGKNLVNIKSLTKAQTVSNNVVEFLLWFHFGSSGKKELLIHEIGLF